MNIWHRADPNRIKKDCFLCCIEISKGSKNKYELDKYSGALILDRVLYTSTHYPHNYGFIPRTLAEDGDALDVLVLCSEPIVPLAIVECYPVGLLKMSDEGKKDAKIIAVVKNDPNYNYIKDINDIPSHVLDEIKHFFVVYKQLEGKYTTVSEFMNKDTAQKIVEVCINAYNKEFKD